MTSSTAEGSHSSLARRTEGPPANLTSFPKLLASDIDDTMDSHKSYELAQALASYSAKMGTIEQELARLKQEDKSYQGYSSQDLANAFQDYAKAHQGEGLPAGFNTNITSNLYTISTTSTLVSSGVFYSWAALLMQMQWARVIYCIVWVISGLILIFFGYASFFWLNKIESGNSNRAGFLESFPSTRSQKNKGQQRKKAFLSGGVGGMLMGFLFFSYLASVINNTICVDDGKKSLSAGAFFAVWLTPGLLGAFLGGYFYFLAKVITAILGGTSFTIILTAMFGIETILIRAILLVVIVTLFTAPLMSLRLNIVQKLIINLCTSLAGIITLLNGVALFAPPYEASSGWIDLWTMLFCSNTSTSKTYIITGWGTSAFKGYIAGSVLGAVVGFAFELFLHRQSGKDADSEWNEYLGTYTSRGDIFSGSNDNKRGMDVATSMGASARAGLFEPAPNAWQRMVEYFDSNSNTLLAHYGNLSRDGTLSESITDQARRKKNHTVLKKNGPARFQTLNKGDDFDDQISNCSCDDDEKHVNDEYDSEDEDKFETKDLLSSPLTKEKRSMSPTQQLENDYAYTIPRLPILSTSSFYDASQLSGTTANDSLHGSEQSRSSGPKLSPSSPLPPPPLSVTATPSLINAITRI